MDKAEELLSTEDDEALTSPPINSEICRLSSTETSIFEQAELCRLTEPQATERSGTELVHHAETVLQGDMYNQCSFYVHRHYYDRQRNSALPIDLRTNQSSEIPIPETNEELQLKLKRLYKKAILPCVHWLNEGVDFVLKDFYVELEQVDSTDSPAKKPIKLQDLFENVNEVKPKRLLLEGQPGYGKTTVATKLAYDWAMDQTYLQQFDAVFLIPLRQVRENSLEEAMNALCKHCDFKKELDLREEMMEKMLLILDGFDELGDGSRKEVLEVLYESKYSPMSVVVTCRSGLFPLTNKELQKLLPKLPQQKKTFYHKRVTILGIGKDEREQFLKTFCPNVLGTDINRLIARHFEWGNQFISPLLLIMIGYFANTHLPVKAKLRSTDLFKSLFNNIVKCNLTRDKKLTDEEFYLFDISQANSLTYQQKIAEFGEVCLKQLTEYKYTFENDDLIIVMYSLGLLSNQVFINLFKTESQFGCFHLSIMEFCAAYSIWRKFETGEFETEPHDQLFTQLKKLIETRGSTTLVTIFIGNLLEDAVTHLFEKLFSVGCNFSDDELPFWRFLAEVKGNDNLAKCLVKFIPKTTHSPFADLSLQEFYCSRFHSDVVRSAVCEKRIGQIYFKCCVPVRLPDDVTIPVLYIHFGLDLDRKIEERKWIRSLKEASFFKIQCEISFSSEYEERFSDFLSLRAEKMKMLKILSKTALGLLVKSLSDGIMKRVNFQHVICDYQPFLTDVFCSLLENNRIYELHLFNSFAFSSGLQDIFKSAGLSSSLHKLTVWNHSVHSVPVDFHYLGTKKWIHFELDRCDLYCSQSGVDDIPCQTCAIAIEENRNSDRYFRCNKETGDFAVSSQKCMWWNEKPEIRLITAYECDEKFVKPITVVYEL